MEGRWRTTRGSDSAFANVYQFPWNRRKDAKASVDVGSDAKREVARELLTLFAQALNGMLGDEGLTLQGAGIKLRPVPGFSEAMAEAKVTGVGDLERFIRLFTDMFVVEGEGQRKRVRRGVGE